MEREHQIWGEEVEMNVFGRGQSQMKRVIHLFTIPTKITISIPINKEINELSK